MHHHCLGAHAGASFRLAIAAMAADYSADAPFEQQVEFGLATRMLGRAFGTGELRAALKSKWRVRLADDVVAASSGPHLLSLAHASFVAA